MNKYSAQDVSDAIAMLDIYTSQRAWSGSAQRHEHARMTQVQKFTGASPAAYELASDAWHLATDDKTHDLDLYECAAEGAQRLREGWRP